MAFEADQGLTPPIIEVAATVVEIMVASEPIPMGNLSKIGIREEMVPLTSSLEQFQASILIPSDLNCETEICCTNDE